MSRIVWNETGKRFFETGVDRGVLYTQGNSGVPWNGISAINETPTGGEPTPYYLDGEKYLNLASSEEYEASIEAFNAPKEFEICEGVTSLHNGLLAAQQPRQSFSLSYRTKIGNDIDNSDHAYQIHLVYDALAQPTARNHATVSDSPEAMALSWSITTLPPKVTGFKPTSHFVIDTRHVSSGLVSEIEDILYGTEEDQARIPSVSELLSIFENWS